MSRINVNPPLAAGDRVRTPGGHTGTIRSFDHGDLVAWVALGTGGHLRAFDVYTLTRLPPEHETTVFKPGDHVRTSTGETARVTSIADTVAQLILDDGGRATCPVHLLTLIPPDPAVPDLAPCSPFMWANDDDGDLTLYVRVGNYLSPAATIDDKHDVTFWWWLPGPRDAAFECISRTEAVAVVRAIIGIRSGVEVPGVE